MRRGGHSKWGGLPPRRYGFAWWNRQGIHRKKQTEADNVRYAYREAGRGREREETETQRDTVIER